uniref:Polyketide synthase n=1 Tax=Peronospora matthiolae TaxID=2874970 RepID=A0AAV1UPG6_9STRA
MRFSHTRSAASDHFVDLIDAVALPLDLPADLDSLCGGEVAGDQFHGSFEAEAALADRHVSPIVFTVVSVYYLSDLESGRVGKAGW